MVITVTDTSRWCITVVVIIVSVSVWFIPKLPLFTMDHRFYKLREHDPFYKLFGDQVFDIVYMFRFVVWGLSGFILVGIWM